ncbi:nucleotidyl transferase AbiEii/AbiGii toxin family protein [Lactococcus lactis]|uniref:nucleotidyl transferase AbiEii/AbiGii toxin family protein n=1 Tax=Lactococcus lactis TaxID=1358 RepID=UPI001913C950|nr:nucleotidyl transferase AbiEii/AbiGii toxin family protein [Lactococcus lactis]WDA67279.1 nucleotidyl transferase AbiEii/AbiGii toxin family protein [Lactococcus lactis]
MNSNRLKDLIKNQDTSISSEEYRIRYATERFLLRVQRSSYRDKLILKGGFLLGTLFKVEQRTTKDLDTLITELSVSREQVETMLESIIQIDLNDNVKFELIKLIDSQQRRIYDGFKAKLKMNFLDERTFVNFDLDLGVGDTITPEAKKINIPLLFNEVKGEKTEIALLAYPLETILAEKTEIILNLGTNNSRMKDFYDMHLLLNDPRKPDNELLYQAFENTWIFRHPNLSIDNERFEDWYYVIESILENDKMNSISWHNYIKDRLYAKDLNLKNIVLQFKRYLEELEKVYIKRK